MDYSELVGGGPRHFRVVSEVLEIADTTIPCRRRSQTHKGCNGDRRRFFDILGLCLSLTETPQIYVGDCLLTHYMVLLEVIGDTLGLSRRSEIHLRIVLNISSTYYI